MACKNVGKDKCLLAARKTESSVGILALQAQSNELIFLKATLRYIQKTERHEAQSWIEPHLWKDELRIYCDERV